MSDARNALRNTRGARNILLAAVFSAAAYAVLAAAGDLRERILLYLPTHAALAGAMLVAWRALRGDHRNLNLVLGAALVFRILAALGPPALSDDVYRYVWDGRVQLERVHPYRYAPTDPALSGLRDDDWERINHPALKTIYPPVAEAFFAAVAATRTGVRGFKLVLGVADFGVVLCLLWLLGPLGLPRDRLVLYAWNPLAVLETAGSGHVEPLGVLLVLLAAGWIVRGRHGLSTVPLAAAIHVKLFPLLVLPGCVRRYAKGALLLLPVVIVLPLLPYALTGPAIGSGTFDYAERWEHNAFLYSAVQDAMERLDTGERLKPLVADLQRRLGDDRIPWDFLYRHVWPRDMARLAVLLIVLAWTFLLAWRRRCEVPREFLLVFGAALLLSPTVHPWYLLWVLPLAAAYLSWGWVAFGLTVPLAYCASGGDVSWTIRWIEYLPPLVLLIVGGWRGGRVW